MKQILLLGILCLVIEFSCMGQNRYSSENLAQFSTEQLNTHLTQFHKLKNTGLILTLSGSALFVGGVTTFSSNSFDSPKSSLGVGMFISGFVITFIGSVMWGVNASRIKKVKKILHDQIGVSFELAPCMHHEFMAQSNHTGLTLRISF